MAEAKVTLTLDVDSKTGEITIAAQKVGELGDKTKAAGDQAKEASEGFGLLGAEITKLVTVTAIEEFFRRSVQGALADEEAHKQLKFAVESTGQAWNGAKPALEAYAQAQEDYTRFSKTETLEVLQKLIRISGDVSQGLAATTLAENIAASGASDLGTATMIVTSLLAGQERGVIMAEKTLGAMAGTSKDTTEVLQRLQVAFAGAADKEEGFGKSLAQSKNRVEDMMKAVGQGLLPVVEAGARSVAFFAKGWEELANTVALVGAVITRELEGIGRAMGAALTGHFKEIPVIYKQTMTEIRVTTETYAEEIAQIEKRYSTERGERIVKDAQLHSNAKAKEAQDVSELNFKMAEKEISATNGIYQAQRFAIDKEVAAAHKAGLEMVSYRQDGETRTVSLAQWRANQIKQIDLAEKTQAQADMKRDKAEKDAAQKADEARNKKKVKDVAETLGFISSLQSAHNEGLAAIGKAAAISETIINTYAAAGAAYKWGNEFGGPILGASMAAIAYAAGMERVAAIAGVALEEGGVVQGSADGTRATIGEKGKTEAVIPLDNPTAMAKLREAIMGDSQVSNGGDTINFQPTFYLPGIESFRDGSLIEEVLQSFIDVLRRRTPTSITFARLSADVAAVNKGRAV